MLLEMFSTILLLVSTLLCQLAIGTSAASCSTKITVDSAATEDCSATDGRLANKTCSELQDVLLSLEKNSTHPESSSESGDSTSCVEVRLLPGHYLLTRNFTLVGLSLKLVGVGEDDAGSVHVSFNLSESFDPTQTHSALYVLSLADSSLVEIVGISFWNSPGIITAHNVETVLVENCSFRYLNISTTLLYFICAF